MKGLRLGPIFKERRTWRGGCQSITQPDVLYDHEVQGNVLGGRLPWRD